MDDKTFKIVVACLLLGIVALFPLSWIAYKAYNAEMIQRGESCCCCGLAKDCSIVREWQDEAQD